MRFSIEGIKVNIDINNKPFSFELGKIEQEATVEEVTQITNHYVQLLSAIFPDKQTADNRVEAVLRKMSSTN